MQRILADLTGMSIPSGVSSPPPSSVPAAEAAQAQQSAAASPAQDVLAGRPREIGGRAGPEPTRFGDWEKNGRCIDF